MVSTADVKDTCSTWVYRFDARRKLKKVIDMAISNKPFEQQYNDVFNQPGSLGQLGGMVSPQPRPPRPNPILSKDDAPQDLFDLAAQAIDNALDKCMKHKEENRYTPHTDTPMSLLDIIGNGSFSHKQFNELKLQVDRATHQIICAEARIALTNRLMGTQESGRTEAQQVKAITAMGKVVYK
jgi:hypothetical protein